jgi:hypothetical protein
MVNPATSDEVNFLVVVFMIEKLRNTTVEQAVQPSSGGGVTPFLHG